MTSNDLQTLLNDSTSTGMYILTKDQIEALVEALRAKEYLEGTNQQIQLRKLNERMWNEA